MKIQEVRSVALPLESARLLAGRGHLVQVFSRLAMSGLQLNPASRFTPCIGDGGEGDLIGQGALCFTLRAQLRSLNAAICPPTVPGLRPCCSAVNGVPDSRRSKFSAPRASCRCFSVFKHWSVSAATCARRFEQTNRSTGNSGFATCESIVLVSGGQRNSGNSAESGWRRTVR